MLPPVLCSFLQGCEGLAVVPEASTAVYCVMLDHRGEALFGVGDMAVHEHVTPEHVSFVQP